VLAQLVEAEAGNSVIGAEQLAAAALATSKVNDILPEAQLTDFLEQLADSAITNWPSAGLATVFGKIVTSRSPVSVSDVAEGTGLPQDEVKAALKPLLRRRYIVPSREDGLDADGSVSPVQLNEADHRAIGISVLPDKVIGVLTNLRASNSEIKHVNLGITDQRKLDVNVVVEAVSSLVREFLEIRSDVIGLGIELPGHINGRMGQVIYSPLLQQRNIPLKQHLEAVTKLPTVVENDANALAVYEQFFSGGTGMRDFAVVLLPERGGVGSGLVSNGRIVYGATGAGGELGHIEFEPNGQKCDCEKLGCLETVAGVSGILRKVVKKHGESAGNLTAAMELARKDAEVEAAFRRAGEALGWGISIILNLLDPERVILFVPTQLKGKGYAAGLFRQTAQSVSAKLGFSLSPQTKLDWRPLPDLPVLPYGPTWNPRPEKGAVAASAVLGRLIRRPLERVG
jgi:predicted NBD/HSP70 family sugar kinase